MSPSDSSEAILDVFTVPGINEIEELRLITVNQQKIKYGGVGIY